jgi:hypothetical protein
VENPVHEEAEKSSARISGAPNRGKRDPGIDRSPDNGTSDLQGDVLSDIEFVCAQLAEGKSLRKIAREMGKAESTIRYWLSSDPEAFAHSARARELGCDALADECLEIADDKLTDAADRRIMIDTRLRLIGKWSQRYGDKLTVDNRTEVTHRYDLDSLSDGELGELERILANAGPSEGGEVKALPSRVHELHQSSV